MSPGSPAVFFARTFSAQRSAARFRFPAYVGVALAAAGIIGAGAASASPPSLDDPIPAPGIAAQLPPFLSAPAPDVGAGAANSFLQTLNGMLNNFLPGAGSIIPQDIGALTPPAVDTAPAAPAVPDPPGPPAPAKGVIAGAITPGEGQPM